MLIHVSWLLKMCFRVPSAPFTIQRLCELLCSPRKHYKRTDKFMRGVEKNLLVVSTVDPEQRYRSCLLTFAAPVNMLSRQSLKS